MAKLKNNLHYFKISKDNPEEILDEAYCFFEKDVNLKNYIETTKNIKNLLTTIKILEEKKEKSNVVDKYYNELMLLLKKYANSSEFGCFINACDNTINEVQKNIASLKQIVKKYFHYRDITEITPPEWIQAVRDTNSSRKKGKSGEKKLINLLESQGYKYCELWTDFQNAKKAVISFSQTISLKFVRDNLGINLKTKKQGKALDLIIKTYDKYFILEAKHINTSGGGQDKQISELIEIISLKEKNINLFFIIFFDGCYSNILLSDANFGGKVKVGKLQMQRKEIFKYLAKNKNSFWLNTVGFQALIKDLD